MNETRNIELNAQRITLNAQRITALVRRVNVLDATVERQNERIRCLEEGLNSMPAPPESSAVPGSGPTAGAFDPYAELQTASAARLPSPGPLDAKALDVVRDAAGPDA